MNVQDLEKYYKESLNSLKAIDLGKVESISKKLIESANSFNLKSLYFAAEQLIHFKKFGISAINVGGTMGSGKSTVGSALAKKLNWELVDADEFHPPANIEKQRRGEALTTEDRIPFLNGIAEFLRSKQYRISTCSALKSEYRAVLAGQDPKSLADGWNINSPNYGLFQILVYKPYHVALDQLDRQSKGLEPKRLFKGSPHFINVTKESEDTAREQGKLGILEAQFKDLESSWPLAWEAIVIDVEKNSTAEGYDIAKIIQPVLGLVF